MVGPRGQLPSWSRVAQAGPGAAGGLTGRWGAAGSAELGALGGLRVARESRALAAGRRVLSGAREKISRAVIPERPQRPGRRVGTRPSSCLWGPRRCFSFLNSGVLFFKSRYVFFHTLIKTLPNLSALYQAPC